MYNCTPETDGGLCGGIDLGGTKIETTLFGKDLSVAIRRRRATPRDEYADLLDAVTAEIEWLRREAGSVDLPVGIGIPGLIDPATGVSLTSNLPARGRTFGRDLQGRAGAGLSMANDCKCFALSEANGGAGDGIPRVFGLVIGTGVGGGFCVHGHLDTGANGLAGEVGHFGIPAHVAEELNLRVLPCGCGRDGCYETLVSGPGMSAICRILTGSAAEAHEISRAASAGDPAMKHVLDVWCRLAAELLFTIQLTLDPDCFVLGGGLSEIPGIDASLEVVLDTSFLPSSKKPSILKPVFGTASGCRGAALLSLIERQCRKAP